MKRFALSSLTALVGCLPLFACGGEESTDPGQTLPPAVASVAVTPSTATLVALGETLQLTASALDASGNTISSKTFTWASADVSIATVSSSGLVTAVVNGHATISATADGVNGTAAIEVDQQGAQLAFSVEPTGTFVEAPITPAVEVTIQDALGNLVADATDVVVATLGVNPSGGMVVGTPTVTSVNGVATFSDLSVDLPGVGYTLVASSGTLTDATSASFDMGLLGTIEWPFGSFDRATLPSLVVVYAYYNGFFNPDPCVNANTTLADVSMPWNSSGITHRYDAGNDPAFLGFTQCMLNGTREHLALGVRDVSGWGVDESSALDTGAPDLAGNTIDFIDLVVDDASRSGVAPNLTVLFVMRWLLYGH